MKKKMGREGGASARDIVFVAAQEKEKDVERIAPLS